MLFELLPPGRVAQLLSSRAPPPARWRKLSNPTDSILCIAPHAPSPSPPPGPKAGDG
jgi:hypothetical protein